MNQDDFRRLLTTPSVKSGQPPPPPPPPPGQEGGEAKETEKKKRKFYKPKKAKEDEKKTSAYRDRAAERREGKAEQKDEEEFAGMTADETKFLGGDMEHTHLVKGLDVALMEKVRLEQQFEAALARAAEKERQEEEAREAQQEAGEAHADMDSLASRVCNLMGQKPESKAAATIFAPGRMAYVFELADKNQHVPTMAIRAVQMVRARVRRSPAALPSSVIDDVANVLAYAGTGGMRSGSGMQKLDRPLGGTPSPKAPQASAPVAVDVLKKPIANKEDAIFSEDSDDEAAGGAGASGGEGWSVKKGEYFGSQGAAESTSLDPLNMVLGISANKVAAAAKALAAQKERERKVGQLFRAFSSFFCPKLNVFVIATGGAACHEPGGCRAGIFCCRCVWVVFAA